MASLQYFFEKQVRRAYSGGGDRPPVPLRSTVVLSPPPLWFPGMMFQKSYNNFTLCIFPPSQQYLGLKKRNPAEISLCRVCFLAYEDLHTDVFPLFWGLIIPIFGPKSLCIGQIDHKIEVKLIPRYF